MPLCVPRYMVFTEQSVILIILSFYNAAIVIRTTNGHLNSEQNSRATGNETEVTFTQSLFNVWVGQFFNILQLFFLCVAALLSCSYYSVVHLPCQKRISDLLAFASPSQFDGDARRKEAVMDDKRRSKQKTKKLNRKSNEVTVVHISTHIYRRVMDGQML